MTDEYAAYPHPTGIHPAVWAATTGLLRLAAKPLMSMPTLAKQIAGTGYHDNSTVPDDVVIDYLTPILGDADGVAFMTALNRHQHPGAA